VKLLNTKWQILRKRSIAPNIKEMDVYAPKIAKVAKPGQFVIVMVDEYGERIPLTLVDWNGSEGWIRIVFAEVGVSTMKLGSLDLGKSIYYVLGPLGVPTHIDKFGTVVVVGGGVAIAAAYPIAKAFKEVGNKVISIIGAKTSNLLIYEEEMQSVSDELYISTDDGSRGYRGFISHVLENLLESGLRPSLIWMVGPAIMMKICSDIAKKYNVKAIASLNPIMVCGMGMCGACRVKVAGKIRFTCFEGPEFDALNVDWDELLLRLKMYKEEEQLSLKLFLSKVVRDKCNG